MTPEIKNLMDLERGSLGSHLLDLFKKPKPLKRERNGKIVHGFRASTKVLRFSDGSWIFLVFKHLVIKAILE